MKTELIHCTGYWIFVAVIGLSGFDALCAGDNTAAKETPVKEQSALETKLRDCVIYLPDGTAPSVKGAAEELQCHLAEVIGRKLDIVRQPVSPMIALGDSPEARAAGIKAAEMPYESFRILSSGGNLFIVGRDLAGDGPTTTDGLSLGTLYGTYGM